MVYQAALLVVLLAGCPAPDDKVEDSGEPDTATSTGPTGPSRIEPDCAPDDGRAVRLIVGLESGTCDSAFSTVAHARISLWTGAGWPILPGTYPFDSSSGSAWYAPTDGAPEQYASDGEVTVTSAEGGIVTGTYTLALDSGDVVDGTFEATACETSVMCG